MNQINDLNECPDCAGKCDMIEVFGTPDFEDEYRHSHRLLTRRWSVERREKGFWLPYKPFETICEATPFSPGLHYHACGVCWMFKTCSGFKRCSVYTRHFERRVDQLTWETVLDDLDSDLEELRTSCELSEQDLKDLDLDCLRNIPGEEPEENPAYPSLAERGDILTPLYDPNQDLYMQGFSGVDVLGFINDSGVIRTQHVTRDVGSQLFNMHKNGMILPVNSLVGRWIHMDIPPELDFLLSAMEDLSVFLYRIIAATTHTQITIACLEFGKKACASNVEMVLSMTLHHFAFSLRLPQDQVLTAQNLVDQLGELRENLNEFDRMKKMPKFKNLYRVMMYFLCNKTFESVGISLEKMNYTELEAAMISKDFHMGPSMLHCILDTSLWLMQIGVQWSQTGHFDLMLHTGDSYEKWLGDAQRLKRLSFFTSNLEPHGITLHEYIHDLKDAISKGESIVKHGSLDKKERQFFMTVQDTLVSIDAELLTKKVASMERAAPFSYMLFGPTSVGKSMLQRICMNHVMNVMGLPKGDEYVYFRQAGDEFWPNFNSSQHTVVVDDAAYQHAHWEIDPTVREAIQIANNTPMCPNQAKLEDKGRTPMLCKQFLVSTNTKHLNASHYFSHPIAAQRRFPFVINVSLKQEFADEYGKVQHSAIPEVVRDQYPDIWNLRVEKPVGMQEVAVYELIREFTSISEFLVWFTGVIRAHGEHQDHAMREVRNIQQMETCAVCFLPARQCVCILRAQADEDQPLEPDAIPAPTEQGFCLLCNLAVTHHCAVRGCLVHFGEPPLDTAHDDDTQYVRPSEGLWFKFKLAVYLYMHMYAGRFVAVDWFISLFYGTDWRLSILRKWFLSWETLRVMLRTAGARLEIKLGYTKVVLGLLAAGAALVTVRNLVLSLWEKSGLLDTQGLSQSIGTAPDPPPAEKPEKKNVWYYHDPYVPCHGDFSEQVKTAGSQDAAYEEVERKVRENTAYFMITGQEPGKPEAERIYACGNMLCLGEQVWMLNLHGLPNPPFWLTLRQCTNTASIQNGMRDVLITPSMIFAKPDVDLLYINLLNYPPGFNLRPYFVGGSVQGVFRGKYLARKRDGSCYEQIIENLKRFEGPHRSKRVSRDGTEHSVVVKAPAYFGVSTVDSIDGQCGSPLLVRSGVGPFILGIHIMGGKMKRVGALYLTREMLDEAVASFSIRMSVSRGDIIPISEVGAHRSVGPLHQRSGVLYSQCGFARVYGSFGGFRVKHKSSVRKTLLAPYLARRGYECKFGAPSMGYMPFWHALQVMANTNQTLDNDILGESARAYLSDVRRMLPESELMTVKIFDNHTALNGAPGVEYCEKLNRNTSAGAPFKRGKKLFLEPMEGPPGTDWVTMNSVMENRVDVIIQRYLLGVQFHPQFCAQLKDEALKELKVLMERTRVFLTAEMAWTIVMRKYYLSLVMLMQRNKFIFESMTGTVAQSLQWQEMYQRLMLHGGHTIIDGDYADYDKRMSSSVILHAFWILQEIARDAGYGCDDILVMKGIAQDVAFSMCDYNGDLIQFFGSNPSGHSLTVVINCIVGSLYMRVCFIVLGRLHVEDVPRNLSVEQVYAASGIVGDPLSLGFPLDEQVDLTSVTYFKLLVILFTYGDDNQMSVSSLIPHFNHTSIQTVLEQFGIVYTMADKEAESVPYREISETEFLKRKYCFDSDIGAVVAPLAIKSIKKMLMIGVASKVICQEARDMSAIASAVREAFFHGREYFDMMVTMLKNVVEEANLSDYVERSTFPTWERLRSDFYSNSALLGFEVPSGSISDQNMEDEMSITLLCQSLTSLAIVKQVSKGFFEGCLCCGTGAGSPRGLDCADRVGGYPPQYKIHDAEDQAALDTFMELLDAGGLTAQMDQVAGEGDSETTKQVVTTFIDEANGQSFGFDVGYDGVSAHDQSDGSFLTDFFSRPVSIANFVWLESDAVGTERTIYPWDAFFNDARIAYKANNFAFVQCDLELKIMVNASPFYAGLMNVNYLPNYAFTDSTVLIDAGNRHFIPYSQRPGGYLMPQEASSLSMTLPFWYHRNWLNIQERDDLVQMGSLKLVNFTTLASANGAIGTGATIQIYAWAKNIKFSGPSVGLAMQSDEYGTGVVSAPASAIASAASWFENIPIIGKFATATRVGASAVSAIASLFGFTNVPTIADTDSFRPVAFPQMATTTIGYPAEKLTLDPKNELSIDPGSLGLPPTDDMVIANLVQRESYLTTATWTGADAADTILFSTRVTPTMYDVQASPNPATYLTTAAWIGQLFKGWRGDLIFGFRVIATKYHKGRLRISYDPSGYAATNVINQAASQMVVQTHIIDIGEESYFEIRIPYQQATAFMQNRTNLTPAGIGWSISPTPAFPYSNFFDNGTLVVRVQTLLTSPVAVSTVPIVISVRGAENLEFANPTELPDNYSFFTAQSDEVKGDLLNLVAGESSKPHPMRYLMNYGEAVMSLRQVLRRQSLSVYHMPTSLGNSAHHFVYRIRFSRFPMSPGFDPNGYFQAIGLISGVPEPYTWTNMTPYNWIAPAFAGQRGSMQWTINLDDPVDCRSLSVVRDTQTSAPASVTEIYSNIRGSPSVAAAFVVNNLSTGSSGRALTSQKTNAGLTVQLPNYTRFRFQSTTPTNAVTIPTYDGQDIDAHRLEISYVPANETYSLNPMRVWMHCGIGTDFGLYYFINVPTFVQYTTVPTPV